MITNSNHNEESNEMDKNDLNWLNNEDLTNKQELPNYTNAINASYPTTTSHLFQSPPDYLNAIGLNANTTALIINYNQENRMENKDDCSH